MKNLLTAAASSAVILLLLTGCDPDPAYKKYEGPTPGREIWVRTIVTHEGCTMYEVTGTSIRPGAVYFVKCKDGVGQASWTHDHGPAKNRQHDNYTVQTE